MRLFKIKNNVMYKTKNIKDSKGTHTYAVWKDKKTNKYRAVQLTHMYERKKEIQLEKGYLRVEKFPHFKYPTGVHNTFYDSDVNGSQLDFGKKTKHKYIGKISTNQANRIKKFANKRHK